jgi:hypothetical protein
MSSDTFHIRVQSIVGDTVDLLCSTSTAGGLNDYACTRSFALMAIEDGMPYPSDGMTPLQAKMRAVGGPTPPVWEKEFHRAHVGTFIASTELVERRGIITDEHAWMEGHFGAGNDADAERLYPPHRFLLRVRVTDPRWLEGLEVGSGHGTTAYDAWWDDPERPSNATLAEIESKASYWYPPEPETVSKVMKRAGTGSKATATDETVSGETASKKVAAKKTAAKKTAAKKATTKKATAKKTARKTTAKKAAAKKTTAKKTAKKAPAKKTAAKRSQA